MKILIADAFDESLPGRLAPFGEVLTDPARLKDAEVVLVRSKTKVTREFLNGAPNLKLVIRGGVGLDNVDIQACRERGIDVKNTPRASSVAVAELTMALMLAVPSRLVEGHTGLKQGRFLKKELKRTELLRQDARPRRRRPDRHGGRAAGPGLRDEGHRLRPADREPRPRRARGRPRRALPSRRLHQPPRPGHGRDARPRRTSTRSPR